jgi:hypothetical protein
MDAPAECKGERQRQDGRTLNAERCLNCRMGRPVLLVED